MSTVLINVQTNPKNARVRRSGGQRA